MVCAISGLRWRPTRVGVVPLLLLPISVLVMAVMVATEIGGVAGERLVDDPVLIVPTVFLLASLAGALCLRRRFPLAAYSASVTITALIMVFLQSASLGISPLYWFAAVALGMRISGIRLVTAMIAGITVEAFVAASVRSGSPDGGNVDFSSNVWVALFNATLTATALVLLGSVIAVHRRQVASGANELNIARREQQSRTERAVEAERTSMARELHDVAAHHLTGMLIQAKNAERLLATDPDLTRELLAGAIGQGHRTLDGLRQIVGILRMPDGAGVPPPPMIADILSLVEGFRAAFAHVRATICEESADIDSGVQLACYRIVQESLSNASRHAPHARVMVCVERTAAAITVSVINDAGNGASDGGGQGLGLVGMRERVALLGGSVIARPDDGGWIVCAVLPVDGRIAA